jgi:hypothetical protein
MDNVSQQLPCTPSSQLQLQGNLSLMQCVHTKAHQLMCTLPSHDVIRHARQTKQESIEQTMSALKSREKLLPASGVWHLLALSSLALVENR